MLKPVLGGGHSGIIPGQSDVYMYIYIYMNHNIFKMRPAKEGWQQLGRPWHGRIAGKWYRSSSKRLVPIKRGSLGILVKARVCVWFPNETTRLHEINMYVYIYMRFRFCWAFHTFVFRSRCQSPTKHVDPITRGGSGSHAVWSLADGPPGSDEK